jgi:hypothetical protein
MPKVAPKYVRCWSSVKLKTAPKFAASNHVGCKIFGQTNGLAS